MTDDLVGLERWPGYERQSWAERFAELDRRTSTRCSTLQNAIISMSAHHAARIKALEGENRKLRADLIAHSDDATVDVCVHCEARLFDGDDYVSCPSGESAGCWSAMTDIVPKRERPCFAYRTARAALAKDKSDG